MTEDDTPTAPVATRYSTVAIVLHWLIAALLFFEVGLGLRMVDSSGSTKFAIFQLHKSIGITILLLVSLRLVWRFYRIPPAVAAKGWERVLAMAVHTLFYVLLFALPISGWVIISSSRIAVPTLLYGIVPWPHLPGIVDMAPATKHAWNAAAEFVHVNLVTVVYVLVALHIAGALKHHFLDRDGDIARMAPGTKTGSWSDPRLIAITLGVILAAGLGLQWLPFGSHVATVATAAATPPAAPAAPPAALAQPTATPSPVASQAADADTAVANSAAAVDEIPSWTIASGSSVRFRTTWSGEAIAGGFTRFDGDIDFSPDQLDRSRVDIAIRTGSVFSGDAQRDETLQSADWFSVGSHQTATFKANRFRKLGGDRYVATGTLRVKAVTLPISLPFTLTIKGDTATMRGSATVDRIAYKIGLGDFASTTEIPADVTVDVVARATRK